MRWIGVILIVIGAAFISYSQHAKEKPAPPSGQSIFSRRVNNP